MPKSETVGNKGEASENGRFLSTIAGKRVEPNCPNNKRQIKRPDIDGRTLQPIRLVSLNSLLSAFTLTAVGLKFDYFLILSLFEPAEDTECGQRCSHVISLKY